MSLRNLTDKELEEKLQIPKFDQGGGRRTGKGGPGILDEAWDKYSTRKWEQLKSVGSAIQGAAETGVDLGKQGWDSYWNLRDSGADFREGNRNWLWTGNREGVIPERPPSTQQLMRQGITESRQKYDALRTEQLRRSNLTDEQQELESISRQSKPLQVESIQKLVDNTSSTNIKKEEPLNTEETTSRFEPSGSEYKQSSLLDGITFDESEAIDNNEWGTAVSGEEVARGHFGEGDQFISHEPPVEPVIPGVNPGQGTTTTPADTVNEGAANAIDWGQKFAAMNTIVTNLANIASILDSGKQIPGGAQIYKKPQDIKSQTEARDQNQNPDQTTTTTEIVGADTQAEGQQSLLRGETVDKNRFIDDPYNTYSSAWRKV